MSKGQHQQDNAAFGSVTKSMGQRGLVMITPCIRIDACIENVHSLKVRLDIGPRIRQIETSRAAETNRFPRHF